MMSFVGRPDISPRLRVDFSARDLIASLSGGTAASGISPFAGKRLFFLSSGRAGLWLLLKSLKLKPGSRIGVPLFVCDAVFEAIVRAGCQPIFLDVDQDAMILTPDSLTGNGRIDAVIAVHLFGNPVNVRALRKESTIPVIEDCAHAVFSEEGGERVGGVGTGAVYSFGLGKPISIGRLGGLAVNDAKMESQVLNVIRTLPIESKLSTLSRSVHSYFVSSLYQRPWYGLFSFELGRMVEGVMDPMQHEAAVFETADVRLETLVRTKLAEYRANLPHQRQAWRELADAVIDGSHGTILPQATSRRGTSDSFLIAMRCQSRDMRENFVDSLLRHNVDSIRFYDQIPAIAKERFGYKAGAPVAEELTKTVVVIPVPATKGERVPGLVSDVETAAREST